MEQVDFHKFQELLDEVAVKGGYVLIGVNNDTGIKSDFFYQKVNRLLMVQAFLIFAEKILSSTIKKVKK